jgi:hypothetical protein
MGRRLGNTIAGVKTRRCYFAHGLAVGTQHVGSALDSLVDENTGARDA